MTGRMLELRFHHHSVRSAHLILPSLVRIPNIDVARPGVRIPYMTSLVLKLGHAEQQQFFVVI